MKKNRLTEEQIIDLLKQIELGITIKEVCRQPILSSTINRRHECLWPQRIRSLEDERTHLKKLLAE